jgi:hypothetical protein
MIGNGSSYSVSTITAGSNISVTNGAGSITLSSPSVTLSAGSGISISGSHPTFTITSVKPAYNQAIVAGPAFFTPNTTFTPTAYEVTIAATYSNSRIKISVNGNGRLDNGLGIGTACYTIFMNYTDNLAGSSLGSLAAVQASPYNTPVSMSVICTPGNTTSLTYTVYVCSDSAGGTSTAYFNDQGCCVPIIAEEIFV